MVAISKTSSSTENNDAIEKLSLILSNLKPNLISGNTTQQVQQQQQQQQLNNVNETTAAFYKSKFKTIKIFVASNKFGN